MAWFIQTLDSETGHTVAYVLVFAMLAGLALALVHLKHREDVKYGKESSNNNVRNDHYANRQQ
jgi:cell division protein FtsI/penicillin-binding protein 2